ncbi:unnamed protein product [Mesocestoides corti]|uniref:Uncharacterized protein n=1 Tax=Mesocestoides corti TaxID=53468 RepID=A0A0R3U248_MESCO|nr:unnamed protein product [Mesocestoides corti]
MPPVGCEKSQGDVENEHCINVDTIKSSLNCINVSNAQCFRPQNVGSVIPPPANPFYPLSNPRDTDLKCEICSEPAYLHNIEHQKIDWVGIHEQICSTLGRLRKPFGFIPSEEDRRKKMEEIQHIQLKMVQITKRAGQRLLLLGMPQEAVPAALQCLKFSSSAYGMASVELVVPYLILAESSLMLKRIDQAESYLAQAQWTMLKTQHECPHAIRSALHRKMGLLYTAKGEYQAALESLAQDIFYSSCAYGPNHIRTAGGYFQMASVFYKSHCKDIEFVRNLVDRDCEDFDNRCKDGQKPTGKQQFPGADNCRPMPPALVLKERPSFDEMTACVNSQTYMSRVYKKPSVLQRPVNKDRVADDLYARVVDIWAKYLASIIASRIKRPETPCNCKRLLPEPKSDDLELGE